MSGTPKEAHEQKSGSRGGTKAPSPYPPASAKAGAQNAIGGAQKKGGSRRGAGWEGGGQAGPQSRKSGGQG